MDDEWVIEMLQDLREGLRPLDDRAEKAFLSWLKTSARFEAETGIKWLRPMLESPRSMFRVGYTLGAVYEAKQTASPETDEEGHRRG